MLKLSTFGSWQDFDFKAALFKKKPADPLINQLAPTANGQQKQKPLAERINAAKTFIQQNLLTPFSGAKRNELLAEASAKQIQKATIADKDLNRHLFVSTLSFGLSLGSALSPLLGLLSIPGLLYTSWPAYRMTYKDLQRGKITINLLLALTLAACLLHGYWVLGNLAILFFVLSRKLVALVRANSQKSLTDSFHLPTRSVWLVIDGEEVEAPFETLTIGQIISVHAGEAIPVDGTIVQGIASIDQHILTGEAQPAEKEVGAPVFASTTVLSGKVHIRVDKAQKDTLVAQITEILNNTAKSKTTLQLRAEDLADRTVVPTLILSAVALPLLGTQGALVVLFSHFRYKLSTLAPISMLNFLNLAAHHGILIKEGVTLDLLSQVDTIVFDKTGTLTQEQPHIGQIHRFVDELHDNEILRYAAAAEYRQSHPIARAILAEARQRHLDLPEIAAADYKVGYGLTVLIDQALVQVGSLRFMELEGLSLPPVLLTAQAECHTQGHSLVLVAVDKRVVGALEMHATVRPEAKEIIRGLRERHNIQSMYIISGDHEAPTRRLAQELGIDHYFAQTLPQDKARLIEQLRAEGKYICYIGDGINDSIALTKAQISISLRGASTMAVDTAQIVLMDGSLRQLVELFDLGRHFDSNMKMNFGISVAPMIISIGGAFFLNWGLFSAIVLSKISLLAGLANAALPLRKALHKPQTPS